MSPKTVGAGSSPRAWGTLRGFRPAEQRRRFIPTGVGNTRPWPKGPNPFTVHPHGRGEHDSDALDQNYNDGSSPRAWGTPAKQSQAMIDRRFIPTGVGNTRGAECTRSHATVHPHGRGEHVRCDLIGAGGFGSSPRAWGTRLPPRPAGARHRFIPTGVGNTSSIWRCSSAPAVHPHGRGEHSIVDVAVNSKHGSSPRAWGTHPAPSPRPSRRRFIPTGVGNTGKLRPMSCTTTVHPHGRGEHLNFETRRMNSDGSSPRAWGTPYPIACPRDTARFIPTGVGNTVRTHGRRPQWTVHPHGRGEHLLKATTNDIRSGSSPRAWGTRPARATLAAAGRFIPTGVGNTLRERAGGTGEPVHPHGRGEHGGAPQYSSAADGSSPRAWGTRGPRVAAEASERFIPTGVGNTPTRVRRSYGSPVHPHGRGEHLRLRLLGGLVAGSSPRAWGTQRADSSMNTRYRFIPTGVGNTEPPSPY
mgnify:CR=1 FL=1